MKGKILEPSIKFLSFGFFFPSKSGKFGPFFFMKNPVKVEIRFSHTLHALHILTALRARIFLQSTTNLVVHSFEPIFNRFLFDVLHVDIVTVISE